VDEGKTRKPAVRLAGYPKPYGIHPPEGPSTA
jgi:hypothetical protein